MTKWEGTDACEDAVAVADVVREGTTDDERRRRMAMSMKASWAAGVVESGAEEKGAPPREGRLEATSADVVNGAGTDLNRIHIEARVVETAGGGRDGITYTGWTVKEGAWVREAAESTAAAGVFDEDTVVVVRSTRTRLTGDDSAVEPSSLATRFQ